MKLGKFTSAMVLAGALTGCGDAPVQKNSPDKPKETLTDNKEIVGIQDAAVRGVEKSLAERTPSSAPLGEVSKSESAEKVNRTKEEGEVDRKKEQAEHEEFMKMVREQIEEVNELGNLLSPECKEQKTLGDAHHAVMTILLKQRNDLLSGKEITHKGICILIEPSKDGGFVITKVTSPSPAMEVGVKPGGEIVSIDGKDAKTMKGNEVVMAMLGPNNPQNKKKETVLEVRYVNTIEKFVVPIGSIRYKVQAEIVDDPTDKKATQEK